MSAETFLLCFQLRGAVQPRTQEWEMKGVFPDDLKPSNARHHAWEGCLWLDQERGWQWGGGWLVFISRWRWGEKKRGAEKRASLRGGEFRGTASPAHHPRMWSSRRRRGERRVTARRGVPWTERPERLTGPSTLPWSRDPHQSGTALENRIPTHLKQRQEKKKRRQNIWTKKRRRHSLCKDKTI